MTKKKRNRTKKATRRNPLVFRTKAAAQKYAKRNGLKGFSIRKAKYKA